MSHAADVKKYVQTILTGKRHACIENKQACQRYLDDLKNPKYVFVQEEADYIINIIEGTIVLLEGEDINGNSFRGKPLLLQPWQKFIVYNLFGFYKKGTIIRRFEEALIFIPKKNGKTPFAGALAWAFAYRYAESASKVLLTSNSLKQALYSFNFIHENLKEMGIINDFRVRDNNNEHVIFGNIDGGAINIEAFAGNPENKDGLKANFVIADEIHEYKSAKQYTIYQKAMKGYRNKLMLAITTAGDDPTSFAAKRLKTCQKILAKEICIEEYFVFITKAEQTERGEVDYLDPVQHEMANPSYNVIVMPDEIKRAALLASFDSEERKAFLAKELNIYTDSVKAYFNLDVFQKSDIKYSWVLDELAKLKVIWYGGVDLSQIKDLTAACLYGHYNGVDIIIPHAFFPVTRAKQKAEQDNIDLYAWLDDDWLTMCNSNTIDYNDVIQWFVKMRAMGFVIREVRYDRRFGDEFVEDMKTQRFKVVDQSQRYVDTTKGFNRIDKMSEEGKLYYLHSEAFEYCIRNVYAADRPGGFKQFDKIPGETDKRIDIFAAAVFAAVGMLCCQVKEKQINKYVG